MHDVLQLGDEDCCPPPLIPWTDYTLDPNKKVNNSSLTIWLISISMACMSLDSKTLEAVIFAGCARAAKFGRQRLLSITSVALHNVGQFG